MPAEDGSARLRFATVQGTSRGGRPLALVVEDDPAIARFVELGLGYEGYDVRTCVTGDEALRAADERPPAVVILDWNLPGLDGLEVCRRLRGRGRPAIVMLTARDAVEDRVRGLEAGADDYLVKPFHFPELLARIKAIERRRGSAPGGPLVRAGISLDIASREVRRDERDVRLTPREFDLLRLLLEHANVVLEKSRIVEQVWGYDFEGDDNIVEVYVGTLRDKLGDRPPRVIETVRGVGYVLRDR